MSWNPHVTVAAVITDADGRYLLVEESPDGIPVFNQPAGHLEADENLIEAVCREVREETCREFTPEALIGIYQWVSPNGATYLRFCFSGRVGNPLPDCQLDSDIIATHWASPADLANATYPLRSPMVLQCIQDHAAGKEITLDMLHQVT